jgi:hypothetical protein
VALVASRGSGSSRPPGHGRGATAAAKRLSDVMGGSSGDAVGAAVASESESVASYTVNEQGVAHARRLIDAHQYVLRSRWNDVQPRAADQNAFLKTHSWDDYSAWHLALTYGAADDTKARYAFVYGDFRRLHRMGLIACHYRAAEWNHKEIELAAHELLQYLDERRG